MDGYAIISIQAKVGTQLIILDKKGYAGSDPNSISIEDMRANSCSYVTTGGPVADFFDAVIPIEETELSADNKSIIIKKEMKAGQFIRAPGSDI